MVASGNVRDDRPSDLSPLSRTSRLRPLEVSAGVVGVPISVGRARDHVSNEFANLCNG